jgi:hypothetical protein
MARGIQTSRNSRTRDTTGSSLASASPVQGMKENSISIPQASNGSQQSGLSHLDPVGSALTTPGELKTI